MKTVTLKIDFTEEELAEFIALEMSYGKILSTEVLLKAMKLKLLKGNTLLTPFEREKDLGSYMIAANALVDAFFPEEDVDAKAGD